MCFQRMHQFIIFGLSQGVSLQVPEKHAFELDLVPLDSYLLVDLLNTEVFVSDKVPKSDLSSLNLLILTLNEKIPITNISILQIPVVFIR